MQPIVLNPCEELSVVTATLYAMEADELRAYLHPRFRADWEWLKANCDDRGDEMARMIAVIDAKLAAE